MKARIFAIALAISILIVGTIPIYADVMTGTEVIIGSDLYNDATTLGYIVANLMNGNGFDFSAFTGTSVDFLADVGNAILGSDILRNYIDFVTDDLFGNTETISQGHTFGYHSINKDIIDTVNMSFGGDTDVPTYDAETLFLIHCIYDLGHQPNLDGKQWFDTDTVKLQYQNIYDTQYLIPIKTYRYSNSNGVYPTYFDIRYTPYCILIDLNTNKYHFYNGERPIASNEFFDYSQNTFRYGFGYAFAFDYLGGICGDYLNYVSYNGSENYTLANFIAHRPFTDLKSALVNLIGIHNVNVYVGTVDDYQLVTAPSKISVGGGANLVYPSGSKQLVYTVPDGSRFDYDLLKQIIDSAINNHDELTIDDIMNIFVDVDGQSVLPVLVIVRNDFDNLINEQYGDNQLIVPFNYISDVLVGSEPLVVLMNDTSDVIPIEVVQMLLGGGAMVLLFVVLRRMGD